MRRLMVGVLTGLALALPAAARATILYVSPSGSADSSCTPAEPCRRIQRAVDLAADGDTIEIAKGKYVENVVIAKDLVLQGASSWFTRVSPAWPISVFTIQAGAYVHLNHMKILHGHADDGGGIRNFGVLDLDGVLLWQNEGIYGGGIKNENTGSLQIINCEFLQNSTPPGAGAGSALYNEQYVEIRNTRIVDNHGAGAAIVNMLNLFVYESSITGNSPNGVDNRGDDLVIVNSTIAKNAEYGIYTEDFGQSLLWHATVAQNGSTNGGGGISMSYLGNTELLNTIVAYNKPVQCKIPVSGTMSAGGSLASDGSCQMFPSGNFVNTDPKLGPLKYNGGWTQTYALLKGSPAIDAGYAAWCKPTDQRGVLRAIDGNGDGVVACDIGAFEYLPSGAIDSGSSAAGDAAYRGSRTRR